MTDVRTGFSDSTDVISGSSGIESPFLLSDVSALNRLSETLESILLQPANSFSDAKIILSGGREVAVHRCILANRSPFFKNKFCEKNHNVKLEMKELASDCEIGFDSLMSVLNYMYSGKIKGLPKDVCVCVDEECSHEACRPAVDFMVEVIYAFHVFQITEMAALWQRRLLDILHKASVDDILGVLSIANICGKSCEELYSKCIDILVKSDVDFVTLDKALPEQIVKQIIDSRFDCGLDKPGSSSFPNKHVKRVHRALDSDDVELVTMLLREGHTSLDGSCALHYAVAYADAKTTTELLDLALADVNHKNSRGFTVLHVAAMRKEPSIIVSLLTKGARPADLTPDGRKALQISKRLTRAVDYNKTNEDGKESTKGRLCIEILEQAERRNPLLGEASASLAMAGDDLRGKLLYLENRVALASLLFPMEAKVAMEIAQVEGTSEFTLESVYSQNLANAQRTVDLNDAPFMIKEEHLARLRALSKTVELGKRFFPRCSEILNKIVDSEWQNGKNTPEEPESKKQKYLQAQETLNKAFHEDKEEFEKSYAISSSSSSTSCVANFIKMHGRLQSADRPAEACKRQEAERQKKEEMERRVKLNEIAERRRKIEQEVEERERLRKESILRGTPVDAPAKPPCDLLGPGSAAPAAVGGASKYVPRFHRGAPPAAAQSDKWGSGKADDRGAPPPAGDKWRPCFRSCGGGKSWSSSKFSR